MMRSIALAVTLFAVGCQQHSDPEGRSTQPVACSATSSAIVQRPPKSERELPTTSAAQFLEGLNGQVSAAERMVEDDPGSVTKRIALGSLLGTRGKLFGDLEEVQRGIDVTSRAVELSPNEPEAYLARASLAQTLHRFSAAHSDLEKARALGGSATAIAAIQQELDWNEGNYDAAISAIRAARISRPTALTVAREARLQHDLGDYAGADRLYALAEDLIDDTSPVLVAYINFQRGYHAYEIGRIDEAIVFYSEAVRRLPTWITAQEHLAEVLVMSGRDDEAIAIYEDVTARSRDPELLGALADVYRAKGRVAEAEALHARAAAGFDEYTKKFPEAAWAHGSEFYLGAGNDPARALAMREANVRLRPNAVSWAWLAEARLALNDRTGASEAIEQALRTPQRSSYILWTAARIAASLDDRARASSFASEACSLNPRVAIDEAPLQL